MAFHLTNFLVDKLVNKNKIEFLCGSLIIKMNE